MGKQRIIDNNARQLSRPRPRDEIWTLRNPHNRTIGNLAFKTYLISRHIRTQKAGQHGRACLHPGRSLSLSAFLGNHGKAVYTLLALACTTGALDFGSHTPSPTTALLNFP
jgi:hypothetical protein